MSERLKPPVPTMSMDDFKKRNSDENQAYLSQLFQFANKTSSLSNFHAALNRHSHFTNLTSDEIELECDGTNNESSLIPRKNRRSKSQGLIVTGHEGKEYKPGLRVVDVDKKYPELIDKTLRAWLYYIALYNHPEYLDTLYAQANRGFQPPVAANNIVMDRAEEEGRALTIHDLTLTAGGAHISRVSRSKVFARGLTTSYKHNSKFSHGREQARGLFVAGENPDVMSSSLMLALLTSTNKLAGLPRDAAQKDPQAQADLAAETFKLLPDIIRLVGRNSKERKTILDNARHNLVGVLESEPDAAVRRAKVLYEEGVRTFRPYSPEPNSGLCETVKALREYQSLRDWEDIEIFAGQVVSVEQAIQLEEAGADAIYLGVGGGGRCITGVVANLAIDWPQLLWKLRGKINIPVIVQGGGNDNPSTTVALGASGIGVVGKLAGSIESPGGLYYFADKNSQELFKWYGGEASDRMRAIAGREDSLGRTINTEGETTKKYLIADPERGIYPTSLQFLASLEEALATGFVFQNAINVEAMQTAHTRLRLESAYGSSIRETH